MTERAEKFNACVESFFRFDYPNLSSHCRNKMHSHTYLYTTSAVTHICFYICKGRSGANIHTYIHRNSLISTFTFCEAVAVVIVGCFVSVFDSSLCRFLCCVLMLICIYVYMYVISVCACERVWVNADSLCIKMWHAYLRALSFRLSICSFI